jgi:hypothetical protein
MLLKPNPHFFCDCKLVRHFMTNIGTTLYAYKLTFLSVFTFFTFFSFSMQCARSIVCACACIHVCSCACMHACTCVHACVHASVHANKQTDAYVWACGHMRVYMSLPTHSCVRAYVRACVHMCVHACVRMSLPSAETVFGGECPSSGAVMHGRAPSLRETTILRLQTNFRQSWSSTRMILARKRQRTCNCFSSLPRRLVCSDEYYSAAGNALMQQSKRINKTRACMHKQKNRKKVEPKSASPVPGWDWQTRAATCPRSLK